MSSDGWIELLDRMLIFASRWLRLVLGEYIAHYNARRPHRSLGQTLPLGPVEPPVAVPRSARAAA